MNTGFILLPCPDDSFWRPLPQVRAARGQGDSDSAAFARLRRSKVRHLAPPRGDGGAKPASAFTARSTILCPAVCEPRHLQRSVHGEPLAAVAFWSQLSYNKK